MRIVCSITVGLMIGLAAQAQDDRGPDRAEQQHDGPREGGAGRGRFRGPNIGFTLLDANGDGVLDATEIEAAPKVLAQLDKDGDGQITSEEVRARLPPRREGPGGGPERERGEEGGARTNLADDMVKTLMAFDANGDGKLTREELPERYQGIFTRGDENKDGFLTAEEIRKVVAAQAPPPERAGRGGGDGEHRDGPRREMNFVRMDPILAAVDANSDGVLSADEIKQAAKAIRKLDVDGDGTVTREEARPAWGPGREFGPRGDR